MKACRATGAAAFAAALAFSLFSAPAALALDSEGAFDLSASGWIAPNVYYRPSAADALASAGLRGSIVLDGEALGAIGLRVQADGYSNLAGLAEGEDWGASSPYLLGFEASGNDRLLAALDVKEAWIEMTAGDLDLRLGEQILAWGLADGSNPTDSINARHVGTRLVSTLDEQKMGTLAANFVYSIPGNRGTIQGLFMPISVTNDMSSIAMDTTIAGTPANRIVIEEDTEPDIALGNVEGGVRALFYAGGLSFSASWLTILDRYPDYVVTTRYAPLPTPVVTTTLRPVHNRVQQFGLDAAISAGGFDLRTEWALTLTADREGDDPAVKNSQASGVVQASRSFLDGSLSTSLSWAPRFVLDHKDAADYQATSDQYLAAMLMQYDGQAYAWENVLSARVSGKFAHETLQPEALFLTGLAARDWFGSASLSYNLADGLDLKLGAAFYGSFRAVGDIEREYGTFSNKRTIDKDYLFAELRWSV